MILSLRDDRIEGRNARIQSLRIRDANERLLVTWLHRRGRVNRVAALTAV